MSLRSNRIRARIERRASTMATDLQRARALALVRLLELVPERELEHRIAAGLPLFTDEEIARAFAGLGLVIRDGVERGIRATIATEGRA